MNRTYLISNGICTLRLDCTPETEAMTDWLVQFLQPVFSPADPGQVPDVTIRVADIAGDAGCAAADPEAQPVDFRRSSCPEYNLSGVMNTSGDIVTAWDRDSGVAYRIDRAQSAVDFFAAPDNPGASIHLHDFTRYLSMLVCQSKGWVTVHASGVVRDGHLYLIAGHKGAGKTTTMINLVMDHGAGYYSGDKVLAKLVEGRLVLKPWPDIPYIGLGSLDGHRALAARIGLRFEDAQGLPLSLSSKHLVDPMLFRKAVPQAEMRDFSDPVTVLLPDMGASGPPRYELVENNDPAQIAEIFEWPSRFLTAQWHGLYLEAAKAGIPDGGHSVAEALGRLRWVKCLGRGRLPSLHTVYSGEAVP